MYTSIYYNASVDKIQLVFIENGWIKIQLDKEGLIVRIDEDKFTKHDYRYFDEYELIGNFKE